MKRLTTTSIGRIVVIAVTALAAATAAAQFRQFGGGRQRMPAAVAATSESFDGSWQFCRLAYQGRAWATDYPDADYNFSTRISELTKTTVSRGPDGVVRPLIVRPTDDALFQCPFVMLWQAESLWFSDEDAARLRAYLLKGGFLWTDDHWGSEEWDVWTRELAKVFPPDEYPIEEVTPADPIFSTQFVVKEMPQIPNIGYWRRSGGDTSEQGADSAVPHFYVVRDHHGRIMLAMTHNTDIADAFEREADDPVFFSRFSPRGYALGINVLLYALTH